MKKQILSGLLIALTLPALVTAETNVNISVGVPGIALPALPRVVFEAAPLFLSPPKLGFYVGVDMPYDMVFISGNYYLFQGNSWYRANHHNGPWTSVRHNRLPREIRNYRIEKIREYREREYRSYQHDCNQYRGRHHRPGQEGKEYRTDERRHDKMQDTEVRHNFRGQNREERQQNREEQPDGSVERGRGRGNGDR